MRIAITGATGNVGTALVRALVAEPAVTSIVGLARRRPEWAPPKTEWVTADIAMNDDLSRHFAGCDAVVHLAWLIQPSRDERITARVNVDGSARVFEAAANAGVPTLIHASSVAAYRPANPATPVDESWPTDGIPSSYYSRQKVSTERLLDAFELRHPDMRVARARPGLIFQRSAASEVRRYFGGPFVPGWLARPSLVPFVPHLTGLAGQLLHADDMADLYRRLVLDASARGAYNAGASPPLDAATVGRLLGAPRLPLPTRATRLAVGLSWRARLHPVSPDWLDVALGVPVMDTTRARDGLGWQPVHPAGDVLLELLAGLREHAGYPTPPLRADAGGRLRWRELRSGIGGPNPIDARSGR